MSMTSAYTRRGLLGLFAVVSGAALAGCDRKPAAAVGVSGAAGPSSPVKGKVGVPILVYRDPECGCCEAWADIARAEGYAVTVENRADMDAGKTRDVVPDKLGWCHPAVIGGYGIWGQVPKQPVPRLLRDNHT